MSNILKGIQLNEVSPHDYDSDWDYQDAVARSGRPRSSYRSQEDDTFDSDVAYSRKIYQATKAAKEKAQRDADHNRLASGMNEEQLDELSPETLASYKKKAGAAATQADKQGDYKLGNKRFSGIVKATKKQFAQDEKNLKEFAADDGEGGEEDTLRKYAKLWYNGNLGTQQQVEQILDRMGWEIGELESEEGGAFVVQAGDENGDTYIGFTANDLTDNLDENLHKWFNEKWVRFGPDGKIRGACARGDDSEGKPKCLPQSKAHSLGKKGRASAAARKRREDPNPERRGPAKNVATKKKSNESVVLGRDEGNFAGDTPVNLGGVVVKNLGIGDIVSYLGQKAKILAMSKTGNTSRIHIPSSMGGVTKDVLTKDLKRTSLSEEELDEACWKGYHKEGNKKMFGKTYPNCVKNEGVAEGLLNESAIFLNPNTVIVGQEHGRPLNLSPETLKRVQSIAAKHGAWYEGNGADRAFTKGVIDNYVGSFDDDVAKIASPNDPKWLYVLFANVDANNRVQRVGVNSKDTIFNRLLATAQDNSFQGIGFTPQALKKFLSLVSEGKYDFVKMSQQPATQENLTRFLKAGEALMWPSNWEQYPNRAGKIAKAATVDARDQYLASRKAGVYVVGSGHLKAVQQISGKQGVAEGVNDYLWHGSREEHDVLYPRQANDTGGKEESNKNAVYATPNAKVAIAMGLTTPGSDTGMFPNDPQMVLFKGNIRKGQMVYLHKVPKDLFIKHNSREWYSKPGVEEVKPIEVVKVPVDQWLHLIRQATPQDLELRKKYMKEGVAESHHSETCPHCGGEMVSEELMNEKKDACYYKVKSRYKVWPSAYASGALVKCRKKGASNWGTGGKSNESIEEGWKEEAQDLEDWSKEVNMRLYRAHESQRPALARQLSKLEQKHFGSEFTHPNLTNVVWSALRALQKGEMVHYDPQRVGQMPFGNIVGDDAKIIAQYNITRDELAGYRMLHDKGMVDNLEQFLKLRRLVRAKSWPLEYYEELEKLTPEEAWLKMANDLNWSKDSMAEEVQAKTDDKLLAYYAQRKAEKQKQQSQSQDQLDEKWTKKYKDSINCSNPKGFSQKAHCAGKKKNESAIMSGLNQLDEGWKEKLGAAALAGSMALGAQARVTPGDDPNINRLTGKPNTTQQATNTAPTTSSNATIPGAGLVRADSADRQAGTVTVDGQDYKMIMLSPTDLRPRGGKQIAIPQAVMGERGIGNYIGILIGDKVFVLPRNN